MTRQSVGQKGKAASGAAKGTWSWLWGCGLCVAVFIAVLEAPAMSLEMVRFHGVFGRSSGVSAGSRNAAQGWQEQVQSSGKDGGRGIYGQALDALGPDALRELCHSAAAEDLLELARAAAATADLEGAKRALRAIRRRFPGHPLHATAGLTLGRLALRTEHDYPRAAAWFERYLRDQPQGVFAPEALRGLIEARRAIDDPRDVR